ncbi:MAG: nuclear transport factor 2 family protein [Acidobacteria bacterium]|nr:nuclear transport factor 2 family protein [Acidobacteriota bacterium]
MKRIYLAFFALLATTLCACSAPPSASTPAAPTASAAAFDAAAAEKAVIEMEKKTWEVYKNKQADEYRKLATPKYRAVQNGAIKDLDAVIKDMSETTITNYSLSDIKVEFPVNDTAVLTYNLASAGVYKGKPGTDKYFVSAVWANVNGAWKAVIYHETKVEPQPKK